MGVPPVVLLGNRAGGVSFWGVMSGPLLFRLTGVAIMLAGDPAQKALRSSESDGIPKVSPKQSEGQHTVSEQQKALNMSYTGTCEFLAPMNKRLLQFPHCLKIFKSG